jgi:hypothetical protein
MYNYTLILFPIVLDKLTPSLPNHDNRCMCISAKNIWLNAPIDHAKSFDFLWPSIVDQPQYHFYISVQSMMKSYSRFVVYCSNTPGPLSVGHWIYMPSWIDTNNRLERNYYGFMEFSIYSSIVKMLIDCLISGNCSRWSPWVYWWVDKLVMNSAKIWAKIEASEKWFYRALESTN